MDTPHTPMDPGQPEPSLEFGFLSEGLDEGLPADGFVGPYRLLEKIGEGGFGEVWLAERREPFTQRVAVKLIKRGMDSKLVIARFEQERQALAMMNHPGIAKVLDGGMTKEGLPYFVMEYVNGKPITDFCDEKRLGIRERLELFAQACEAVQHAHGKGIVHRDIKPSNILAFEIPGAAPSLKVIDFGVAKAMHHRLTEKTIFTMKGHIIGSLEYMSPEQADPTGSDIDTRSDVYSLGVLLYELVVGSTPFDAKTLRARGYAEMLRILKEEDPQTPSARLTTTATKDGERTKKIETARGLELMALARELRSELEWIPLKAMRKEPQNRYPTPTHLADDIRRYLRGDAVEARPASKAYRLTKTWRKHKVAFAATALVFLALTIGLAVAFFGWRETGLARDKAKEALQRIENDSHLANVQMADVYLRMGDYKRLRERLAACHTSSTNTWEWRYLNAASDESLITLVGHEKEVFSVAFSPDGRRLVTASSDQTARIWNTDTGKLLVTLEGHESAVTSVAFSSDGQRVVTGSIDQTARIWDSQTGESLMELKGHHLAVVSVSFSPDDSTVLTWSLEKPDKKVMRSFKTSRQTWDARTGRLLMNWKGITLHRVKSRSAYFGPDGQWVMAGSENGLVHFWDLSSGQSTVELEGHEGDVTSVAYSPNGRQFVAGSENGLARIWDTRSLEWIVELKGHQSNVISVAFSADGRRVATGSFDKTARIWDARSGDSLVELKGHEEAVTIVALSPDGQRGFTASSDGTARIWDVRDRRSMVMLNGAPTPWRLVAISSDGERVVTGPGVTGPGIENPARIWDARTGQLLVELKDLAGKVVSVDFSTDRQRVVMGFQNSSARIWDARTGQSLVELKGHHAISTLVAFSPDGRQVVTMELGERLEDGVARTWDARTGQPLVDLKGYNSRVTSVCFSPDGNRVVVGTWDKRARAWDTRTGEPSAEMKGHAAAVIAVAYTPDGRHVVTGSADNTARIWDANTGRSLVELKGHEGSVFSVACSPDGHRVVTLSLDGTARIWDADSGRYLLELKAPLDSKASVHFSPDGQRIFSVSELVRRAPNTLTRYGDVVVHTWDTVPYRERFRHETEKNLASEEDLIEADAVPRSPSLLRSEWNALFFSWDEQSDPRTNLIAWRALALKPEATRVRLMVLDLDYQMRGPRDLMISEVLTKRGPYHEFFGMVATTALDLPRGLYVLRTTSDDGVRVRVDGKVVLENWTWHKPTQDEVEFQISGEGPVVVEVEHFEIDGYSRLTVELEPSPGLVNRVSYSDWPSVSTQLTWLKGQDVENHWLWFQSLVVDGYLNVSTNRLEVAKAMLDRFEKAPGSAVAERIAKAVLFRSPPFDSDLIERACLLADRTVKTNSHTALFPYFNCVKALAEYRRGHWKDAVHFAAEALNSATPVLARDAQAGAILAMAKYRLGSPLTAREALAKAKALMPESLLVAGKIPPEFDGDWHDLLIAQVLVREANRVLELE